MADTNNNAIKQAMEQPKKGTVDGQSFEQHSLPDLIAADKYVKAQEATHRRNCGLRFGKFKAGSAV